MGVLDGIKVIDLTRVLSGPSCCALLADMGAEVIKVEHPINGDDSRGMGPYVNGESAYYMNFNRNKYGITLNLKTQKGKEILVELVKKADIIIENFRPGVMEKLGLGYDVLSKANPKIVYGCISGFGQSGEYSNRAGYDSTAQAMSGLMSVTGWPNDPPTKAGASFGDMISGYNCCIGVLAAYIKAIKTGKGDKIDISLVDSLVSALGNINMQYLNDDKVPKRIGNRYEPIYPHDTFDTKDGFVAITCGNNNLFDKLKIVINDTNIFDDKFSTNYLRTQNHASLREIILKWTTIRTTKEVVDILLKEGIPCGPVYTIDQTLNDEFITKTRNMVVEVEHPLAGKVKLTNSPFKFKENQTEIKMPSPMLGQHTEYILKQYLNMTDKEISDLHTENVI